MLHRFLLPVLMLGLCVTAFCQQEPQFSHYMYNRAFFNAAYSGSGDALEINALHRTQYVGIAPTAINTQFFGVSLPVYAINSGVGLIVINDLAGALRSTYASVQYCYRHKFRWGALAAGLSAGLIQSGLDGAKLRTPEGKYVSGIDHNDELLPLTLQQALSPDFAAAIYINGKKWHIGLSANHLVASTAKFSSGLKVNYSRNLFLTAGYDIKVAKRFSLFPSVFAKTDFLKAQADFSIQSNFLNNFLAGVSFRGYNNPTIDML
ncbi:MAG: PorP/SprF family type IX secretion system membrane protein, partial [Chitinophagales bacterium]|nr:PorP/SprF family type IX secretion system membrane protein [Chitinophagales bacterium]